MPSLFEMAQQKREQTLGPYSVAPPSSAALGGPGAEQAGTFSPTQQSSGQYTIQPEEAQLASAAQGTPVAPAAPPAIDANAIAGIPAAAGGAEGGVSPLGALAQQGQSQGPAFFAQAPDAMADAIAEQRKWQAIGDLTKSISGAGTAAVKGFAGGGGLAGGLGALGALCDERAKVSVEWLTGTANGVDLYRFQYRGRPEWWIGPIAQQVQTVIPEAVAEGPDGLLRVDLERAGVPLVVVG